MAAARPTSREIVPDQAELDALWLSVFTGAADRVAHGLKNLLNGVAVNLEVVRMRTARGGESAAAAATFASTAATEFERVTEAVEALLALARPEREPVDVATVLGRIAALLGAASDGGRIVVRRVGDGSTVTGAPASAVRAAVASVLQSVLGEAGEVSCELDASDGILIRVVGGASRASDAVALVGERAARHGVQIRRSGPSIELLFPPIGSLTSGHQS